MNSTTNKYSRWQQQVIAFSAVAQSAVCVQRLATTGQADEEDMIACVNPLFLIDADSFSDIYPVVSRLSTGMKCLQDMFSRDRLRANTEVMGITLGILLLRSKLQTKSDMQQQIAQELGQGTALKITDDSTFGNDLKYRQLAKLYQETISTLPYRLQIKGKEEFLNQEQISNKIRALLLAGIRSAVLWQQLGGTRWRLLFQRQKIKQTVDGIRRNLISIN